MSVVVQLFPKECEGVILVHCIVQLLLPWELMLILYYASWWALDEISNYAHLPQKNVANTHPSNICSTIQASILLALKGLVLLMQIICMHFMLSEYVFSTK